MRTTRKHSETEVTSYLKFFTDHPTLTCAETADRLKLSHSYTWELAKSNGHTFKKYAKGGRIVKPKVEEIIPEGCFDFKNFSY